VTKLEFYEFGIEQDEYIQVSSKGSRKKKKKKRMSVKGTTATL